MIAEDIDLNAIKEISGVLKSSWNYDFSEYATTSFMRRISRAKEIFRIGSNAELIVKIKSDKNFTEELVREITVNTTEMFRDPSFWRKLREDILPELAKLSTIRIWHAACSSGEEVYTMAILLNEMGISNYSIIATDINDEVIEKAKSGLYLNRNMELNTQNYNRFLGGVDFKKYYNHFSVDVVKMNPDLLRNVHFRKHDLVIGTPFSKFDLVLCRNVMIYFNMSLQNKVLSLIEQSLFSGSYLAIGSKESIAWCAASNHFKTISAEEKIYQKITTLGS